MSEGKSIIDIKDYGQVNIRLKEILEQKKMTRNRLCVLTGIKFDTVQKYYLGTVYRIDVDVLARLCYALDCKIQDVIEYTFN